MFRPLRQAVFSGVAGYRKGADRYATPGDRGDPATARRLLAEAGYPAGISVRLAYQITAGFPQAAQSLQASLGRAGFDVHLVPLTSGDFYGRLLPNPENARRGEWDIALGAWVPDWLGQSNGRSVIQPLFDGRRVGLNSQNFGGCRNPGVDSTIDRATAAPSNELAEAAWADAARRPMDDVAIVSLVEYWFPFLRSRRVRGGEAGALAVTATPERTSGARLLDARDLRVAFRTPDGVLEAVRGISLLPSGPVVQADRAAASSTGCCVCESPWGGLYFTTGMGSPERFTAAVE